MLSRILAQRMKEIKTDNAAVVTSSPETTTVAPKPPCGPLPKQPLASNQSLSLKFRRADTKNLKVFSGISLVLAAAAALYCCFSNWKVNTVLLLATKFPRSCREVSGPTGIYHIQTHPYFREYPVYCDMETDGGGWTLVASVHENNIDGKCSSGDRWSSEQGFSLSTTYNGSKNWENKNIFGNIASLTNDDYKNSAYYELEAANAMIWHLPNQLEVQEFSGEAFLKYYTTNSFLSDFGGTLQLLYKLHAPLVHAGSYRFFTLLAPSITFAKGDNNTIMRRIPISQRDYVQPGFMQFRAFDSHGFPNALCPGIRIVAGDSSRVCVGGGGIIAGAHFGYTRKITKSSCGDFAGWAGNLNDGGTQNQPSRTGRSLNDINSSIFIFVK